MLILSLTCNRIRCTPILSKRYICFAILRQTYVFPCSFTKSKIPSEKPRLSRLARISIVLWFYIIIHIFTIKVNAFLRDFLKKVRHKMKNGLLKGQPVAFFSFTVNRFRINLSGVKASLTCPRLFLLRSSLSRWKRSCLRLQRNRRGNPCLR